MKHLVLFLVIAACAPRSTGPRSPVSVVRFENADPVWLVDDREPVAKPPAERPDVDTLEWFDNAVTRRIDRSLEAPPARRALGTNSLDEVPTSTWFTNRVGVRDVAVDEVRRGPGDGKGPDRSAPFRVVSAKRAGMVPGFIAEDATGARWIIKFERTAVATESAADIASGRLLWLAGYNVPDNHAGYLRRDDVIVDDEATFKDDAGKKRGMTAADLDALFERAQPQRDGRYRVLFSRFLDGKPLGPTPQQGTRPDDPNDTIPHERRRELRGLSVFIAWLQHTDFKEMDTVDTYREDPVRAGQHAVWHYLVDFGLTLGVYAKRGRRDDGHVEQFVDGDHLRSLLSLGLWRRPWDEVRDPGIPGVGAFDAATFDPGGFTTYLPYTPFLAADELDAAWAVRILLRITPAHIRAALEAAHYEDPRAVPFLADALIGRQRKLAQYWLRRTSPLDDFTTRAGANEQLCFTDLVIAHRLERDLRTRYRIRVYDVRGRAVAPPTLVATGRARSCVRIPPVPGADGYTIVRVDIVRRHGTPIEVHLAPGPHGTRRVIGIERRPPR